jgi:hypothetical protein
MSPDKIITTTAGSVVHIYARQYDFKKLVYERPWKSEENQLKTDEKK